jgi:hypothetical protein
VLGELLVVDDKGVGLGDVGESGASGLKAGLDVLPDLLDLGAHVALADAIPSSVARQLPGEKTIFPAPLTVAIFISGAGRLV